MNFDSRAQVIVARTSLSVTSPIISPHRPQQRLEVRRAASAWIEPLFHRYDGGRTFHKSHSARDLIADKEEIGGAL
jgi:hypothetical protein